MKSIFMLSILSISMVAQAQVSEESKQIAKGVKLIKLATQGFEVVKVKAGLNIKEALYQLSVKKEYDVSKEEFNSQWVGSSRDAWEADSTNYGSTTMREAYSYIRAFDEDQFENEEEKAAHIQAVKKALSGFKYLLNTGVQFGVAPMGAVQCGVRLAALTIYDPHSGYIYILSTEGSGC